jgi:hypothetical protein
MSVLGRRDPSRDSDGALLDLTRTDLRWLVLPQVEGAHLEGARLGRSRLEDARLREAHLEGASLWGAHLQGADLRGAHLERADLAGAHLEGADLAGAHLEGAVLHFATYSVGEYQEDTVLIDDVIGRRVSWRGRPTVWPDGFDPEEHGTRPVRTRPSWERA